jgi:hypothetical protein
MYTATIGKARVENGKLRHELSTPQLPGAKSSGSYAGRSASRTTNTGERGVDDEDVDRPEATIRPVASTESHQLAIDGKQKKTMSHREKRNVRDSTFSATSDSVLSLHIEESMSSPGAILVEGLQSRLQEVEVISQPSHQSIATDSFVVNPSGQSQGETIVAAKLVEDLEQQDKEKMRQEIFDEAEKAEIVDVKSQRKYLLVLACLCCLVIVGAAVGIGFALGRPQNTEVNNSICGNSLPLFLGDTIRGGVGNADVSGIDTCGPSPPQGDVKGRWFSFLGDGTSIIASTCLNTNFDSQISVFTGSSCKSLACVAFNDNNPLCCAPDDFECNRQSAAVTISTDVGVNYYIFVHGTNVDAAAKFELSLLPGAGAVTNDSCSTAVNTASFSGGAIQGSNEFAAFGSVPLCGAVTANGAVGAWYQARGTGDVMVASTCDSTGTLEDTQISVFRGQCNALQCVEGSDNSCGNTKSSATWQSVAGTSYYVFVHGNNSSKGTFDLKIENFASQVDIDAQCQEATTDFYISGIQAELEAITSTMFGKFDAETDCWEQVNGNIACEFDLLAVAENTVDGTCQSLGGRYIEKDFSLVCLASTAELKFVNYPDCVSFLCTDDWIDSTLLGLIEQMIPLIEGSANISCEVGDVSWSDGITV